MLLPRRFQKWQKRERLELPDGDFLDLSWLQAGHQRLALLSHGLEGSAEAIYMRGMAGTLHRAGWDVLGWQNQQTVNNPQHPYAIGGGVARLPPAVDDKIQKTLMEFAKNYAP